MTAITHRDHILHQFVASARRIAASFGITDPATLENHLAEHVGGSWYGGSGWLPHTPKGEDGNRPRRGEDGRVLPEYLTDEYVYRFTCRQKGIWVSSVGPGPGKPDITWREVALAASGAERQVSLFGATGSVEAHP